MLDGIEKKRIAGKNFVFRYVERFDMRKQHHKLNLAPYEISVRGKNRQSEYVTSKSCLIAMGAQPS